MLAVIKRETVIKKKAGYNVALLKKNDTAKCYPVIVLLYATALPCYYLTNVATWYGVTL